jgi:hypothetical protein
MGSGEYGGNGSVHWKVTNRKDRNHAGGGNPHTFVEVDEQPAIGQGGYFVVQVFDVEIANIRFSGGTLSVRVPIKHHATDYTRQVLVTWPPDDITWPPANSREIEAI